jgi:hypothetical protein
MKTKALVIFLLISAIQLSAQKVQSSCTGPDNTRLLYKDDADQLALGKFFRRNLPLKNSVLIPSADSDTILNALMAVYNATSLPARDTIIVRHKIHAFPHLGMRSLLVAADPNLGWMKELRIGRVPTAYLEIYPYIKDYGLVHGGYSEYKSFGYDIVTFSSRDNYNMLALAGLISSIPGVKYSFALGLGGDGYNITDSIYSDHVELVYSVGWGDCIAGCLYRRFWKFNVYFDCSVEFVNSYGDPLSMLDINTNETENIAIYPNPFCESVRIDGLEGDCEYSISNPLGQILISGMVADNCIEGLGDLAPGPYFLVLKTLSGQVVFSILRN